MDLRKYQIIVNLPLVITAVGIIIGSIFGDIKVIFLLWISFNFVLAIYAGIIFRKFLRTLRKTQSIKSSDFSVVSEFMKILIPMACISVLVPLNSNIDNFFITILVPIETVAIYIATFKLAFMINEISRPFSHTLLSSLTYSYAQNEKPFKRALGFTLRITLSILLLALIVVTPISPIIVKILFGTNYLSGYILLPIFIACGIILTINSLFWTISIVLRRVNTYLRALIITTIMRLSAYVGLIWFKTQINLWIPLVLASLVFLSHVFMLLLILILFKDIISHYARDLLKISLLAIPLISVDILLLLFQIKLITIGIIILVLSFVYVIALLKTDSIKMLDLIILRRALPRKLWFLVNILSAVKRKI